MSGEGARRYSGRWNSAGTPIVYAAQSLALAALEVLVHVQDPLSVPPLVAIAITIPDEHLQRLPDADLPEGWDLRPPGSRSQSLGDRWYNSRRSLALSLPSVVVPSERILLLNPDHPDFAAVAIAPPEPFIFDTRLR